ncbi:MULTISPECIES: response regulator transcription factor [unclassified Campylobacter]|uniref:response regulator transcription factor n=1 Tax=unclassified Campylobacter TaxID=2593542 RepID=UPI003D34E432
MYSKIKEILKNVKLLVVDDDDMLRQGLEVSLRSYVSEIFLCKNAADALECFKKHSPNLILSDIQMPKMNGIQMAQIIRKDDENVPIIFLTAFDSDENMLGALELKSQAMLKKPFDKRELVMSLSFAANKFQNDFASVNLQNGFTFNAMTMELFKDHELVALTKKEQKLLHLLLKNQSRMVNFEMIENYVWCSDGCTPDTIRNFVHKLRKKLYPELIQSCHGCGYTLSLKHENLRTVSNISYI